jgi:hypothetical protein
VIELLVAALAFLCMVGSAFVGFMISSKSVSMREQAQTREIISLFSNIFCRCNLTCSWIDAELSEEHV